MKLKIFDKNFRTGKRDVEKKQEVIDKSTQMEIKAYENKSKELLETAEIIEIAHADAKSIDGLKQQRSTVQSAEREFKHSRKELSGLPHRMTGLLNEQIDCMEKLKRKMVKKSTINNEEITNLKAEVEKNKSEVEDFHSGNKAEKLKENVNNNLNNLKSEVAKLEFLIKSIEEGHAPKLPIQPSRSAPLSPIEIRDNFKIFAGYFNNHGAYDEGKQYLHDRLDLLSNFGIIEKSELQNLQNHIKEPNITGQELIGIIKTATDSVDRDLESRMERPVIDHAQKFADRFADRFAGRVENTKGKNQTFADRVKDNTEENMKGNDQVTRL